MNGIMPMERHATSNNISNTSTISLALPKRMSHYPSRGVQDDTNVVDAETRNVPKVAMAATKTYKNIAATSGVWVGVVVLYMLIGEDCQEMIRYEEQYKFHQKYWNSASDEDAKLLIPRMLTVDPS
jgi:hypothetical protein